MRRVRRAVRAVRGVAAGHQVTSGRDQPGREPVQVQRPELRHAVRRAAQHVQHERPPRPAASVQIKLAFRRSGQADGQSYTGNNATALAKGKSELLEADMGPSVGAGRAGDTCTVIKEALISPETLTTLATYEG